MKKTIVTWKFNIVIQIMFYYIPQQNLLHKVKGWNNRLNVSNLMEALNDAEENTHYLNISAWLAC